MQKKTVLKSDIRNFVKESIAAKIEKLKNFLEFTTDASREIKKNAQIRFYQGRNAGGNLPNAKTNGRFTRFKIEFE